MIQADAQLDTLGLLCPMPIILTARRINELPVGQVLEVVSDDEGIKNDLPAWCETTGHELLGLEHDTLNHATAYRAFVRKTASTMRT